MLLTWTSLIRQALSRRPWRARIVPRLRLGTHYCRGSASRRRRLDFSPFGIGAEVLEYRQLLTVSVSAVSPNMAQTQGGTSVSVVGTDFTNVTAVMFGSTPATSWQVNSSSALTAVSPVHAAGAVDLQVVTSAGSSPIDPQHDQFNFVQSAPTVTGVSPNSGGTAGGGSPITVTGTDFSGVSSVMFGSVITTAFYVESPTSLMVTVPQHAAGVVDVIVTTSAGSSPVDPSHDQYTYTSGGPTITGVSPSTGTGSGGTSVTITGTGFSGVTAVTFGGTNATSYVVNSPTSISAVSPGHTPGTVDIIVTAASGASATGSADQFVFTAPTSAPSVTGLGTTSGAAGGGASVVIMGTNFNNVSSVMFGSVAARSFTVNSATSITAITAAESASTVDVTVTNSAGTSATSAADRYTFQSAAPVIASLGTSSGTTAGGTSVTINGSNFMGVSAVSFGGLPATSFTLNSPTSITAIAPAHAAGLVDVTVTSPNGTSAISSSDQYAFAGPAAPLVTNLSASIGSTAGGATITITGSNFTNATGVSFGSVAAAYFTISSDTSIIAISPAESAGTVDVTVTTALGTSPATSADQFTFSSSASNPSGPGLTVIGLATTAAAGGSTSPATLASAGGPTTGGTSVTIFGTGFLSATGVQFGSVPATSFTIQSDGEITAISPAWTTLPASSSSQTINVTVQSGSTTSAVTPADQYTYTTPGSMPIITGLDISSGSAAGGDVVTISGVNLGSVTGVSFGSVAATEFLIDSANSIVAIAPALVGVPPSGGVTVDITLTSAAGTSAASPADQFTYLASATSGTSGTAGPAAPSTAPAITGLSLTSGSLAGGDRVTITGTNLTGVQSVLFGSARATFVVANPDGTITATTPAGSAGPVDVTVQTLNGTSALTAADQFTYAPPAAAPTVTSLGTAGGSTTGGTVVTITGTNFTQVTGVNFGTVPAASFAVVSPTTITAVAPGEGAGPVDVTVTTTGGTSAATAADQFTYSKLAPIVTALSASSGFTTGGESITIYGVNLSTATGVMFVVPPSGGSTAQSIPATSFTVNEDGTLTAVVPPFVRGGQGGSGPVTSDVLVQNSVATSAPHAIDQFVYTPAGALPTVASLSNTNGTAAGGALVVIAGTNFTDVSGVTFGGVAALSFQIISPTSLIARAPAITLSSPSGGGQVGASTSVDIQVTTAAGTSPTSPADRFTYTSSAPVVTSLGSASGFTTGGDTVSIYGGNFTGASAVYFGSVAATFTVVSDKLIKAVAPSVGVPPSGGVDITVTTPAGTSATSSADQFTIIPAGALPTVSGVSGTPGPTGPSGSSFGGDSILITGTNFADVTGVSFGVGQSGSSQNGQPAASFTVISATSISVVTPAVAVGTVDVIVTTTAGRSPASGADSFTFTLSAPSVTGLSSASGYTTGAESVTISGDNLAQVTGVYFGNTAAASFTANADGSITAVAPAFAGVPPSGGATVDVTVRTAGGTSPTSAADQFVYTPAGSLPTVTSLSSSVGSIAGGQTIDIKGANFTDVTAVTFVVPASGGNPTQTISATSFQAISATEIAVVVPPFVRGGQGGSSATADVQVTTTAGTSAASAADQYTFALAVPVVTSLSLVSGFTSGGDHVTITGINLAAATGVFFVVGVPPSGGSTAQTIPATSFTVNADGSLTAIVPPFVGAPPSGSVTADIRVQSPTGTSAISPADQFTFIPAGTLPSVSALSVSHGSSAGGGVITITGANFADVTAVTFGGVPARSFTVVSSTQIDAVAPSIISSPSGGGQVGASINVDVQVTTTAGPSPLSTADFYTFTAPLPKISRLSASSGFAAGGDSITIFGSNLSGATAVTFVDAASSRVIPATSFTINPDGSLSVVVPPVVGVPASGGVTADIRVQTPAGTTGVTSADRFTFTPTGAAPTVTALSATAGATAGGQLVTITGTNFTDITGVSFGGVAAALFVVDSPTSIVALSPSSAAGTVNVTVSNAVGTSAVTTADQFTSSVPVSPGPPTSSVPPQTSYVVSPWSYGQNGINPNLGNGGLGASGLETSFTAPDAPGVPVVHLVGGATEDYAAGFFSWWQTDGGTVVTTSASTSTDDNGATDSVFWSDTITFSFAEGASSSGPAYTHIVRSDDMVMRNTHTAVDGTGFIRDSTANTQVTYDYTASNGVIKYTLDSTDAFSSTDHEQGVSAPGANDVATVDATLVSGWRSHFDATVTVSSGAVDAHYNSSDGGTDTYDHTDTSATAISTEADKLSGSDTWHHDNNGTYNQSANGTWTATNTANESGSGNDLYSRKGTQTVASDTSDAGVTTVMIDLMKTDDKGTDNYFVGATGTESTGSAGMVSDVESHNDGDSGAEEVKASDNGIVATNEVDPDGTVIVGTDQFGDSSDDNSHYRDGDVLNESAGGGSTSGGTDQFATHDDDKIDFETADIQNAVATSIAPAGAVTNAVYNDKSSDNGTDQSHDDLGDNETLPTSTTAEVDKFTFDDGTGEQDQPTDNGKIVVTINGFIAPGDLLNSVETIKLHGDGNNSDTTDDPGTETDTMGAGSSGSSDVESDTFTDKSDDKANLSVDDVLQSNEVVTGLDGSQASTQTNDHVTDGLTLEDKGDETDQEGAVAGSAGETDTDHAKSDDRTNAQDTFGDNSVVITNVVTPVPNGVFIQTGTVTGNGSDFTTDTSEDKATDDNQGSPGGPAGSDDSKDDVTDNFSDETNGTTNSQGFSMLIATDPTTGVQTTISTGDIGTATGNEQVGDVTGDDMTSGAQGSSDQFEEVANIQGGGNSDDHGPVEVNIVGSPSAGITENFDEQLFYDNQGGDSENGQDTSNSPDSDSGDLKFQTTGESDVSGTENSTLTKTVNANDGQGTTVSGTDTVIHNVGLGGMTNGSDNGEDDFTDASGQPASDAEADTERDNGALQTTATDTQNLQFTSSTIDPATGLAVTVSVIDGSTDTQNAGETSNGTDQHDSGTAGESDSFGGEGDFTDNQVSTDHGRVIVSTDGTDATGATVHLKEIVTIDDSGTEVDTEDEARTGNIANVDTFHDQAGANVNITDLVVGTITSTDPATGITTTGTVNELVAESGTDTEGQTDTNSTDSNGSSNDVRTSSGNGSDLVRSNIQDTTTQTNSNGAAAAAPTTDILNASDIESVVNGVITDQGAAPALPASTSGSPVPTITGVMAAGDTAAQGRLDGTSVMVITGTGFTSDTLVTVDGVASPNFIVVSSTQIIAVAPAHPAGTVHVTASNAAGASAHTAADQLTFSNAPPGGGSGPAGSTGSGGTQAAPPSDADLTLEQKQEIWAIQNEITRLIGRIQQVEQTLAKRDLTPASRSVHQTLLADLQGQKQAAEDKLQITHAPADPVASMSFGEKFVAALEIALKEGLFKDGLKEKVESLLDPANLAETIATMTVFAAAYAALHGTPLAPLLIVADAGMLASVGTETALALFQIYLDLDSATTQGELQAAAGGMANQLTDKAVGAIVNVITKGAGKAAGAGIGKAVGKRTAPSTGQARPGQVGSAYPKGRRVGGNRKGRRETDPPRGRRENGAFELTPENLARMERGQPPIGTDGKPVELHHRDQDPLGPLDELSSKSHEEVAHPNRPSTIDRGKFAGERRRYWIQLARDLMGQE